MNDSARPHAEQRLRRLVLGVAVGVFVVTPIELMFQAHTEDLQRLALLACVVGLVGTWLVSRKPRRSPLARAGTGLLLAVVGVSVFGLWEHFEHNFSFAREIEPNLGMGAAAIKALFGASPPLAPAILAMAALLPIAAARAVETGNSQN